MSSFIFQPSQVMTRIIWRHQEPCLVAAFQTSTPPLIWQFNLEENHSFSITMREEDSGWNLMVTSPEGKATKVAHFDDPIEAHKAYASVQKALLKNSLTHKDKFWRWIFILFIVFLFLVFAAKPNNNQVQDTSYEATYNAEPATTSTATPVEPTSLPESEPSPASTGSEITNGVPLNADDVLKAPPP